MTIDQLTPSDIEATKNFMLKIIKDDFGYDFNPEWHKDIANLENVYMTNPRACCFVAKVNGEIIGTIAARPYDKDYPEFREKYNANTTLSIWRHYILQPMRGQGIGTQLLKKIESFARDRGYTVLYLHTQKSIPGSLEYWLAKGFSKTTDTMDALQTVHMEKLIKKM